MSGKKAKKFRKEIGKLQGALAADLKGWLHEKPWWVRALLALKIIFKMKW